MDIPNHPYRVLLVDDEPDIIEFMAYNLRKEGYLVETARNGKEAIEQTIRFEPHLLLLDIMMPELDGISTCKTLRSLPTFNQTRILFLSALNEDEVQMAGFDAGADDFICKPIQPALLLGKIKAILKRVPGEEKNLIEIDKANYAIRCQNEIIALPRREFELVAYLHDHRTRICTREELYQQIWGREWQKSDRSLDVHISSIRDKIPQLQIQTIKGVGFRYGEASDL